MVDGERLLLVEDDAATREVLTLLLEGQGWQVEAVESGEAALRSTSEAALALCDLHLPGVCGEALATQLRQRLPEDAVLFAMTATPSNKAAGYDGMVVKPFPPEGIEAAWRLHVLRRQPGVRNLAVKHFGTSGIGGSVGLNVSAGALVRGPHGTPAAMDEPILDLTTMEQLRRGMGDAGMRGLYAFALADAGDRLDRMEAAVAAGDAAAYAREAHALKGSCGMVGARGMARLAGDAETEGLDVEPMEKVSGLRVATEAVRLMLETLFPV